MTLKKFKALKLAGHYLTRQTYRLKSTGENVLHACARYCHRVTVVKRPNDNLFDVNESAGFGAPHFHFSVHWHSYQPRLLRNTTVRWFRRGAMCREKFEKRAAEITYSDSGIKIVIVSKYEKILRRCASLIRKSGREFQKLSRISQTSVQLFHELIRDQRNAHVREWSNIRSLIECRWIKLNYANAKHFENYGDHRRYRKASNDAIDLW